MQLYVGNLSFKVNERDLEDLFHKYSPAGINLKEGYAFVGFGGEEDAKEALHDLNGRDIHGRPVRLEIARGDGPRGPNAGGAGGGRRYEDDYDRQRRHDDYGRDRDYDRPRRHDRDERYRDDSYWEERKVRSREMYGEPRQTPYRLIVKNLSTRCSWQDLKDMMRKCGEVTYADAHRDERNVGFVCFEHHKDLRRAIEKYQGQEFNGREMELIDDTSPASSDRGRSPQRGNKRRRGSSADSRGGRSSRSPSPAGKRRRESSPNSRGSRSPRSPPHRRNYEPSRRDEHDGDDNDYGRKDSKEDHHRFKCSRERSHEDDR